MYRRVEVEAEVAAAAAAAVAVAVAVAVEAEGLTNSRDTAALTIPTESAPMDPETAQADRAQRPETRQKLRRDRYPKGRVHFRGVPSLAPDEDPRGTELRLYLLYRGKLWGAECVPSSMVPLFFFFFS